MMRRFMTNIKVYLLESRLSFLYTIAQLSIILQNEGTHPCEKLINLQKSIAPTDTLLATL